MESSSTSPTIEQSIQYLKLHLLSCIDQGVIAHSAVRVFVSSVHLLCAVKQEQHYIAYYSKRFPKSSHKQEPGAVQYIPFLSPNEIPTIHKLLHDPSMMHVFLLCLSTPSPSNPSQSKVVASDTSNQYEASMMGSFSNTSGPGGNAIHTDASVHTNSGNRKRSMSLSVETSAMNLKMNLVATIIYAVLEHYDHWPTPLVHIYADDCFGPRLWVDNKICKLLVSNLVLSHANSAMNDSEVEEADIAKAAVMAETYRNYWNDGTDDDAANEKHIPSFSASKAGPKFAMFSSSLSHSSSWRNKKSSQHHLPKRQRTGPRSFGSTSSHGSESEDDSSCIVQSSATIAEHADDLLQVEPAFPTSEKRKLVRSRMSNSSLDGEELNRKNPSVAHQDRPVLMDVQEDTSLPRESEIESGTMAKHSYRYPVKQQCLRVARIRNRYHGENMKAAHDAILMSLAKRLDTKSKQNSSLLQCLPSFMEIPGVRKQVAANLEKWLQSPALAGLARSLFTCTVNHIKVIDPPLSDDLQVINSIVGMNLKSNQVNAHIENISALAKKLPFTSVITHLYSTLTKQLVALSTFASSSDHLKMIVAVHRVVPPALSYDAMASVLLMLLANDEVVTSETSSDSIDRYVRIQKLRRLIRVLSAVLGSLFDGSMLLQSLHSYKVNSVTWSCNNEEDKARLMFQCGSLAIGSLIHDSDLPEGNRQIVTTTIRSIFKQLLTYCCTEYGPYFRCKGPLRMIDYFQDGFGKLKNDNGAATWLVTMRCLLFLEPPESTQMKRFFCCGHDAVDTSEWEEELPRIKVCYQLGGEVHSDLIWILLKSTTFDPGIDAEMAIRLLENLLLRCSEKQPISLKVNDPKIIWELYNLVVFEPSDHWAKDSDRTKIASDEFPRLAFSGLWWRVTMIALVFCANSPENIGSLVWREHPTLQAIIKMVTSQRFRFPTVDCDDVEKKHMKKLDYAAREEERRIAEAIFLPSEPQRKLNTQKGARVSRRIQMQQQKKEAAKELAETRRRKVLLDEAHKKIMIWDPDGPARKPPPESVDMLLVVNEQFDLSHLFQRCIKPDFLLMSIGKTHRSAIERAYDWLIPIVSSLPAGISRLPASASCLLLLRAYSTAGDEKKQLKELLAPLLQHVTDSLGGLYGESDAVKAFDLLMTDVASTKADKRRCAGKVLQDSLLPTELLRSTHSDNLFACMLRILDLEHASLLVHDAVNHLFHAAVFETSAILPAVVMSLQKHIDFASFHKVDIRYQFPVILTQLLCTRPHVCVDAMDSNVQFFDLAINTLCSELSSYAKGNPSSLIGNSNVSLILYKIPSVKEEINVPLQLLQSLCVVLSIWNDQTVSSESKNAIKYIADAMLQQGDRELASVDFLVAGRSVLSLDYWMMLAKARCDNIAQRTAVSIPVEFLPRILLCSGLSRSSVLAIIQKLGHIVEKSSKRHEVIKNLMEPTILRGWNMGYIENKRDKATKKKLLARIAAYFRLFEIAFPAENPFLACLLEEQDFNDLINVTKGTQINIRRTGSDRGGNMESTAPFLSELCNFEISPTIEY